MTKAESRVEELERDLVAALCEVQGADRRAWASGEARQIVRIINAHPRWQGKGAAIWQEVSERVHIGRLRRYLDRPELRRRVRTLASLEAYELLHAVDFGGDPKAYLDAVDASLPEGARVDDLALHALARVEAEAASQREKEAVYERVLARLREAKTAFVYFGPSGSGFGYAHDQLLVALAPRVAGLTGRLRFLYRSERWASAATKLRAVHRLAAVARPRDASAPPFSVEQKLLVALRMQQGLHQALTTRIALRGSVMVGKLTGLAGVVGSAYQSYEGVLAAEEASRRERRALFAKLLGAALTPVLGPLAGVVSAGAEAAIEAGVRALDSGSRALGGELGPLLSAGGRLAKELEGARRAALGEARRQAEGARAGLEEELDPERVADRVAEEVMGDGAPPRDLKGALTRALERQVSGFLERLGAVVAEAQRSLVRQLLPAGDADLEGDQVDLRKAAEAALWHVHRTHEEKGRRIYPTDAELVERTFDLVIEHFRAAGRAIEGAFDLSDFDLSCPPEAQTLVEWKLWGLHLDAQWRHPVRGPLEQVSLLSSEVAEHLKSIRFLEVSSTRLPGVIRFSGHISVGAGAKALSGAFVRYAVDELEPFAFLAPGGPAAKDLAAEKERVVEAIYDAYERRLPRGKPPWSAVWGDVRVRLPTLRATTPPVRRAI